MKLKMIILLMVMFIGCKKEPIKPDIPLGGGAPKADTNLIWKIPIFPDTSYCFTAQLVGRTAPNTLLAGYMKAAQADTNHISLFSVSDSIYRLWTWDDYFPDERQSGVWVFNESYAFVNGRTALYGIDLSNGNTMWRVKFPSNLGVQKTIAIIGDRIFHVREQGAKSTLYMADVAQGDWQPTFSVEGENGFESSIKRPVGARNAHGDMILYFQDRQYSYSSFASRVDFYAYNLTKGEILWKLEDISPQESNTSPAVLDEVNRRMYFLTWHTIFCWDMDTGEEIWKVPLAAGVLASNPILYDGKLIMKTDQGYLTAFDAATGQELYYVKQGACCIGRMLAYDGRLYYTDRSLYIVNPSTGEVLHKIGGDFQSRPPVIDAERNVMYLMDRYYMYCYKIPE